MKHVAALIFAALMLSCSGGTGSAPAEIEPLDTHPFSGVWDGYLHSGDRWVNPGSPVGVAVGTFVSGDYIEYPGPNLTIDIEYSYAVSFEVQGFTDLVHEEAGGLWSGEMRRFWPSSLGLPILHFIPSPAYDLLVTGPDGVQYELTGHGDVLAENAVIDVVLPQGRFVRFSRPIASND